MINFRNEDITVKISGKTDMKSWIRKIILSRKKVPGEITFVFCSDDYLGKMNMQYLRHQTLTDIITFDYCEGDIVSGDICISIERVKENAKKFGVSDSEELSRVMTHGVLHLLGYKDKTADEKASIRQMESFYMADFPGHIG